MKKLLFALSFLALCHFASAQDSKFDHVNSSSSYRSCIISASPALLFKTPNGTQFAGGIKGQFFLGKRFSVDGDFVFSRDYAHLSPGLVGVPLALLVLGSNEESSFSDFLGAIAALALSLEHVSYHIPAADNFDISPYVSVLRYKFAYKYGTNTDPDFIGDQFCFASGLQFDKYFGRFVLSPYGEYCIGYNDHKWGFNVGVYLGICFMKKGKN